MNLLQALRNNANILYVKYIKNDNLIVKQSTKRATAFPRRQLPDLF